VVVFELHAVEAAQAGFGANPHVAFGILVYGGDLRLRQPVLDGVVPVAVFLAEQNMPRAKKNNEQGKHLAFYHNNRPFGDKDNNYPVKIKKGMAVV